MKRIRLLLAVVLILGLFAGCGSQTAPDQEGDVILATTYPMYYLTCRLTEGLEGVTVEQMVTEPVSCLHDYTLTTEQMKKIERADLIVMNGCGLEDFMADALKSVPEENILAPGINEGDVLLTEEGEPDPHYWLFPGIFASGTLSGLYEALAEKYPEQKAILMANRDETQDDLTQLNREIVAIRSSGELSCTEMITFHDGFSYFANAANLTIAAAIEEEEGAEPSAAELQEICELIEKDNIPAIFVEKNGSTNAAQIIARETGVKIYTLTTIMDGETDYFTAMRENVQTVKEALS